MVGYCRLALTTSLPCPQSSSIGLSSGPFGQPEQLDPQIIGKLLEPLRGVSSDFRLTEGDVAR
jgi:hypothetical protein